MRDQRRQDPLPPFSEAPWHLDARPAVLTEAQSWSFRELDGRARRQAERLRTGGVRSGEVICARGMPPAELWVLQLALARLGAALLPLPADLPDAELSAVADVCGAEWVLDHDAGDGLGPTAHGQLPKPDAVAGLAVLIRTSGSGGPAKVAMLTAGAVLASCRAVNRRLELGPGDQWLCCLPMEHVGGLAIGWRCALAGATLRLQPGLERGFDTQAVKAVLQRQPVTHLSLVPPMLARLLDAGAEPPPSLRVLLIGGQALHPALAHRALDGGWPLYVTYGMSETFSQVATARCSAGTLPAAFVGPPLPGVRLDCGTCAEAPRRLRLKAPMLMAGYANPHRRPGDGLERGWLTTSDLACLDGSGGLQVLGRADDAVVIGGINVLPAKIEARLSTVPGIESIAVVGIPHPVWGRTLAACYIGDAERGALDAWSRAHLSSAERPRLWLRLERLPVLPSGKLDRTAIERLARRLLRDPAGTR